MAFLNTSLIILACKGPEAGTIIQQNITISYFCAAAGAVMTLALGFEAWRTNRWGFTLPTAAIMLLLHPAWTVSAIRGDCGFFKADLSLLFTLIFFALIVSQYVVSRRRKKKSA